MARRTLRSDDFVDIPSYDVHTEVMAAAISSAKDVIGATTQDTVKGLEQELSVALGLQSDADPTKRNQDFNAVRTGCKLLKFRALKGLEQHTREQSSLRVNLLRTLEREYRDCIDGPTVILNELLPFVRENSVVLVHGNGPVIAQCVALGIQNRTGVRFLIAEGLPQKSGEGLIGYVRNYFENNPLGKQLGPVATEQQLARSLHFVPDSAVATLMSEVDFVIVGANAVTEHGGLVHSPGTLQIATVAQAMGVPFYVLCETFKFSHIFPLTTADLLQLCCPRSQSIAGVSGMLGRGKTASMSTLSDCSEAPSSPSPSTSQIDLFGRGYPTYSKNLVPDIELTPPALITLMFTEKGIMPPSAVADYMLSTALGTQRR